MNIPTPAEVLAVRSAVAAILAEIYTATEPVRIEVAGNDVAAVVASLFSKRGWLVNTYQDDNTRRERVTFVAVSTPVPT